MKNAAIAIAAVLVAIGLAVGGYHVHQRYAATRPFDDAEYDYMMLAVNWAGQSHALAEECEAALRYERGSGLIDHLELLYQRECALKRSIVSAEAPARFARHHELASRAAMAMVTALNQTLCSLKIGDSGGVAASANTIDEAAAYMHQAGEEYLRVVNPVLGMKTAQ